MLGENDSRIFLNNDHFSEGITLDNGTVISGIFDIDDDPQFAGMMEGRDPSVLISTVDYTQQSLRHRDVVTLRGKRYIVESVEPYGADRGYTVVRLRDA